VLEQIEIHNVIDLAGGDEEWVLEKYPRETSETVGAK
jgi:hypothetical protein